MAHKMVVGGRRGLDGQGHGKERKSVWKVLEENNYFPSFCNNEDKYAESDPTDHFICVYNWN
jgi:hypothetical protein